MKATSSHPGGSLAASRGVQPSCGLSGETEAARRFRRKFHICRSAQASGLFVSARPSGYGNPLARTPERVRQDVADGLLSAEGARCDYAVALTSPGAVDEAETARLRAMR